METLASTRPINQLQSSTVQANEAHTHCMLAVQPASCATCKCTYTEIFCKQLALVNCQYNSY